MKSILHAMKERRSVRHFDDKHQIVESELMEILDDARHAPTAFNLQNVRFLVIRDAEQRQKIRQAAWDQPQVTDCSALVVMCADTQAWQKDLSQNWRNAPEDVREYYLKTLIPGYYKDKPQTQRDEAFRSASLAAYGLMLAAHAHGLQSCPMDGFDFEAVKKIVNLPADHELIMFVALGKQSTPPLPHGGRVSLESQVVFDRFE